MILSVALAQSATAQSKPGNPEDNGLLPKSATFYANESADDVNNGKTESLGVAIANNGNVLIGWEDDGDGISDAEAIWTLFNSSGVSITPVTDIKSVVDGATLKSKYLSYFRKDGSPIPGNTSWGPKVKANLFGDGIGMGATSYALGAEVPELAAIQVTPTGDAGDFPGIQLLTNDGKPIAIASGVSDSDADPDGDIRIGDWEYLSNGNIVIIGESRQKDDLVNRWKGAAPANHAIYRIVDATGKEVRPLGLVSAVPELAEIWHGVGVTKNGFAVRFSAGGKGTVRMFDNTGAPISTNIDLAAITGKPAAGGGGRGDGAGFHGNGLDAYAAISVGNDENGAPSVWLTVLNTNGTVRFTRSVADDLTLTKPGRADAAIDASGRVIAAFNDTSPTDGANSLVLGRMIDAQGKPVGKTFYVSEVETAATANQASQNARVAWRGGLAVVAWETKNNPNNPNNVVAARLFSTFLAGSVESAGLKRVVTDTPVINPKLDALGNWEPYVSVVGTSTFLIEGNTFADGSTTEQRYVVGLQPVDGKSMKLGEGFYADNGQPFKGAINLSRQNGNPGRVAGDQRPGAVNFMVGGETSVHVVPGFQGDNRWNLGFDRLGDGRFATVQAYSLNTTTLAQTPLSKAIDAINGRLTSGAAAGNQIGRFGGDIACLDNGNFIVAADDRSQVRDPANITTAVILAPNGAVVKDSFVVDKQDIWSNVASYKGGFCVRVHTNLFFYANSGNLLGKADQATSGSTFDTGRGDGTRIAGHVNSPYVFLAGKISNGQIVKVTAWDARTQKFVATADVSEPGFAGDFDRVNLAVDALNRIVVSWVSKPPGYEFEQVAARVLSFDAAKNAITPVTPSFLAFANSAKAGIRTLGMSVAMTTKEICIAAKGEINLLGKPEQGVTSPREMNFFTVIGQPEPKDDPTTPVGGAGGGMPGLLGYWRMDDTAGDVVTDSSGKGNNGKILNSATGAWVKDAERGTVYRSNGTNVIDFGTILPAMTTNSDFTWSLWIKSDETGTATATDNNLVFGNRYRSVTGSTGADFAPREFVKFTPSKFEWHVNAGATVQDVDYTDFVTNKWTHHLVVKKGTTLTYFRDGELANTRTIASVPTNPQPLSLGGQGTLERWRGYADEVAILDRALTVAEAQQIYAQGKAGGSLTGTLPPLRPTLSPLTRTGTALTITWTGGGKLQEASAVTGPWTDVTGNPAGSYNAQTTGASKFYRVVGQ